MLDFLHDGAGMDEHAMLAGEITGHPVGGGAGWFGHGQFFGGGDAIGLEIFRQNDEIRVFRAARLFHQGARLLRLSARFGCGLVCTG